MPVIQLTQSLINNLKVPAGKAKIEIRNKLLPGFLVEISATSLQGGTYYLRYKDQNGKQRAHRIGRTSDLTLADAKKKAQADHIAGGSK